MNRYPDMANAAMTSALADRLEVEANRLAFGTGSVAVLYHLLQATCEAGDEVVYAWRSFEAYPIAVLITGATPVPVPLGPGAVHDLAAMRAAITPATRAVLLCTPNNPTGPALPHAEVVALRRQRSRARHGRARRGVCGVRHRDRPATRAGGAGGPAERGGAADLLQGVRAGRVPGRLLRGGARAGVGGPGGLAALRGVGAGPGRGAGLPGR